ncbi:MAG: hypothetical protein FD147_116 [Chloroflexi bacterium]|nr:MAG: hypothetical protein FD147_116 [Chloroflexota bacterium]
MTFASIILGTLIASIFGCGFHFWRGGGFKWLILFNIFSFLGFWIGHLLGSLINWHFIKLGPINLGMAILGTILLLFGGYWLSMASLEPRRKK